MDDRITTIVWTVKGYHELLGHIADHCLFDIPNRAGFRLTSKQASPTIIDVQSSSPLNGAIIGGSIALPTPQLLMAQSSNFTIAAGGAPAWDEARETYGLNSMPRWVFRRRRFRTGIGRETLSSSILTTLPSLNVRLPCT